MREARRKIMGKSNSKKKGGKKSGKDLPKQDAQPLPDTSEVIEEYQISADLDAQDDTTTRSKKFALKFASLKNKLKADASAGLVKLTATTAPDNLTRSAAEETAEEQIALKNRL
jgi:hypothetical protein